MRAARGAATVRAKNGAVRAAQFAPASTFRYFVLVGNSYSQFVLVGLRACSGLHKKFIEQGGTGSKMCQVKDCRKLGGATAHVRYNILLSLALAFAAGVTIHHQQTRQRRCCIEEISEIKKEISEINNSPATTALRRRTEVVPSVASRANMSNKECNLSGSLPRNEIIIDYEKIRRMDKSPLVILKDFTTKRYVRYFLGEPGKEHYSFLSYLSSTYGDCRHFTDIGTRYVASSLALGSNLKSPIWTFDLPTSNERQQAFRGTSEEEWQSKVQTTGLNIKFHNLDLMKATDDELKKYLETWFVMLDTFHRPYTVPFEREFFQKMLDIGFKGILGLDDIHLNSEMKTWWKEVQNGAEKGGYHTYDISEIGHHSGTGLVDFSGKVTIKK